VAKKYFLTSLLRLYGMPRKYAQVEEKEVSRKSVRRFTINKNFPKNYKHSIQKLVSSMTSRELYSVSNVIRCKVP
jgi:hypothetical protein